MKQGKFEKVKEPKVRTGKKGKKWWKILLIVLGAILLLLALLAGIIALYINSRLNLISYDEGTKAPADSQTESGFPGTGHVDAGQKPGENSPAEKDPIAATDKDVINILVLGTDERTSEFNENARADSITLVSLNLKKHTINLASIERGVGVPIPGRYDDLITHTFRYGGSRLTLDTVRDCFHLDVNRFIRINFHAFREIIDTIGGIEINLTSAEAEAINAGLQTDTFSSGLNYMDGRAALEYSRLRYIDSNWQRIERQRNVIQAVYNKVRTLGLSDLDELISTVLPMVQTNLTKSEIVDLMWEMPGFLTKNIEMGQMTVPIPGTSWDKTGEDGTGLLGIDFEANSEALHEFFYGDKKEEKN